jgi:hypothetical protein
VDILAAGNPSAANALEASIPEYHAPERGAGDRNGQGFIPARPGRKYSRMQNASANAQKSNARG